MKTKITTILMCVGLINITAQSLGKVSITNDGFTQKKFNHTEKKVYIKHFNINYQTVMIEWAKAKGGSNYGSATAGLALGLDGVNPDQLQKMTDQYYREFIGKLTSQGFTIVEAEEVQKNPSYQDLVLSTGGTPQMDVLADGYLTTSPTGKSFLNHKTAATNLGGMADSKNLEGIVVIGVNLVIPFAETREINGGPVGGVAKITAKCDLRISPSETLPAKGDFKRPKILTSAVEFGYKESLKWQALSQAKLKKPLEIEGVLDESTKYKATSVATTGNDFTSKYSKAYAENAVLVPCDAAKYESGVGQAIQTYLNTGVDQFLGYWK